MVNSHKYRMRTSTLLIITLRGIATEILKNTVLSGVGRVIVLDSEDVGEEDLGSGYLFREEEVGMKVSSNSCPIALHVIVDRETSH